MSVTPREHEAAIVNSLTLQIPASTSNLGPGFDALALALNIYSTVRFVVYDRPDVSQPIVSLRGAIATVSDTNNQGNLIYKMLQGLWQSDPNCLIGYALLSHPIFLWAADWVHRERRLPEPCGLPISCAVWCRPGKTFSLSECAWRVTRKTSPPV